MYVASGLGFSEPTIAFYRNTLLPMLEVHGVSYLDPWSHQGGGEENESMLTRASVVFAVLDGPDVDSGTAAEIGWAASRGTPIVGWRSDLRRAGEHDHVVVNMQVQYFVERHGGAIHKDLHAALAQVGSLLDLLTKDSEPGVH